MDTEIVNQGQNNMRKDDYEEDCEHDVRIIANLMVKYFIASVQLWSGWNSKMSMTVYVHSLIWIRDLAGQKCISGLK